MGLLSSIGNAVKGAVSSISKTASTIVSAIKQPSATAPITSPLFSAQGQVQRVANTAAVLSQSLNPFSKEKPVANVSNQTVKTALETVAAHPYATAAVVSAPIVAVKQPAAAVSIAKSLVPTTTVGKIATVAAVPVVVGAVAAAPVQSAKAVIETPGSLANFGGNVAKVISNPSISGVKEIFKENPVIASTATAAAVAAIGYGAGSIISNIANTAAVKENTKAMTTGNIPTTEPNNILPTSSASIVPSTTAMPSVSSTNPVAASPEPTTPQTQIVKVGGSRTSTKRKKRSSKPANASVRQNVNVIVQNRNSAVGVRQTKRLINREVLMN